MSDLSFTCHQNHGYLSQFSFLFAVSFNASLQASVLSATYLKVSMNDKQEMERRKLKECLVDAKVSKEVMNCLLTHYDFESNSRMKIQVTHKAFKSHLSEVKEHKNVWLASPVYRGLAVGSCYSRFPFYRGSRGMLFSLIGSEFAVGKRGRGVRGGGGDGGGRKR